MEVLEADEVEDALGCWGASVRGGADDVVVLEFDLGAEDFGVDEVKEVLAFPVDVCDDEEEAVDFPSTSATYCFKISRCLGVKLLGILTSNWTSKSPFSCPAEVEALRPSKGTPLPLKSICSPTCVPEGTLTSTSPSSVGTRTLPPSTAV